MWRYLLLAALLPYAGWLIVAYEYHFIDHVNLAFHEAGHIFLTPLGETAHFLGGTLVQLAFPVAVAVQFLRQHKPFEACLGGIWFAESLMYTAEYMGDAQARQLPLVGGGVHDWHFLFSKWGVLESTDFIAAFFHMLAALMLVISLALMCRALLEQRRSEMPVE